MVDGKQSVKVKREMQGQERSSYSPGPEPAEGYGEPYKWKMKEKGNVEVKRM